MFAHLFGPVPSRRLGMSLGVDLVPRKVCSLDCVYCEVGPTTLLTVDRRDYVRFEWVAAELDRYFASSPDPDFVTFSGSGEPTLNTCMGRLVAHIKSARPSMPVAILTNGTTLCDPAVRQDLLGADVVLPSLDAATQDVFLKINRPHASLRIEDYIAGLAAFRREYAGEIRLEIFVLPGYNDSAAELGAIRRAVLEIRPDRVHLNTLDRPGAVEGLRRATDEELRAVLDALDLDNAEIVAAAQARTGLAGYRTDIETAILETVSRRPCTVQDMSAILGLHVNEINKYLEALEKKGAISPVRRERGVFYERAGKGGR
jgi:wyosine [tRNA(Phe)-imidazoG37] synthetase (radical SAM superfamily)